MAKEEKAASAVYDASKIKILGGIEAVRKRPAMYIGSTGKAGLHHLIYEVVDNSIDEALAGYCDNIKVTIHKGEKITVEDNGRGIPFDIHKETKRPAAEVVLTTLHAGGKFGDSAYKVSGGLHGVGVSCVNALSEWMEVTITRDGKVYTQRFERGKPGKEKITALKGKEITGTVVAFKPDPEILTETVFERKIVAHRLRELAFLNKGVKITLIDEREKEKSSQEEVFQYEGGVVSFVEHLNEKKEHLYVPPISFSSQKDNVFIEVAMQHCKDYYDENIFSFVNCIKTKEGGTHEVGFKSALTKSINGYARKNNLAKEEESFSGEDVREGLTTVINLRIPNPQFEGQTKTKLGNSEIKGLVDSFVLDNLNAYLDKNPAVAKAIIERTLMAFRVRAAARKAQELERKKSALDTALLPGKLADCSETNAAKCELFLVEGDSAGGCFSGDTKVALTDGRNLSFIDLAKEASEGKQNYCYSIKNDLSIGIEAIVNPRCTKKNAKVVKIILDNNEEIVCTPEHKFLLRNGTYISAAELTPKMSLMPLRKKISERRHRITIKGYEMVLNPKSHKWVFTHLLSDEYNLAQGAYLKDQGCHKHHKDYNKLNNNPDNIIRMIPEEHLAIHREQIKHTLHTTAAIEKCNARKRDPEYRKKIAKKIKEEYGEMLREKAKKQWEDETDKQYIGQKHKEFYGFNQEYRQENAKRLNEEQKKYWSEEKNRRLQAKKTKEHFLSHPERKEWLSKVARRQWNNSNLLDWRSSKTKGQWTDEFRAKRKKAYNNTYLNESIYFLKDTLEKKGDISQYDLRRKARKPKNTNLLSLDTIKSRFFDDNEALLREAVENYNHKIKKIEKYEDTIDVYDIEVPNTHNFALASGVFVHNSAKQGRDRRFQAILPLRGKILNVEKARIDKILTSQEIRTMITAIGPGVISGLGGNGGGEEISDEEFFKKLNYFKIIIMTDADVDGAHIRTLLLTFFFRYARRLIDNGNLYIAQPPLYLLKKGKAQEYIYHEQDLEKTLKKVGKEGSHVQRYKGLGEMNPEQLWETTMNPESRTLLRVTLEDAEDADEIFKILMGSEVEPRRQFIQENAKYVKRLDV
ncbi:MAG: DNA topoisomerase (ATP-hydrolyzing) subunit B [Candidatus Margulisbacteria bacterium]|nr:DNA topoisomerase (ATP-hydrolyzing) subunit B [Candidatus Margulisiibacteriota bacterium]